MITHPESLTKSAATWLAAIGTCALLALSGLAAGQAVTLVASPHSVAPGGTISVSYSGAPGFARDWIGLYPAEAGPGKTWVTWQYTEARRSGTMTFKAPDKPGSYNFRLFENDGHNLLGTSNIVVVSGPQGQTPPPPPPPPPITLPPTVTPPSPPVGSAGVSLAASPQTVTAGGMISVNYSGAPGFARDWIGLYPAEAGPGKTWVTWQYTEARRSGTMTFKAPDKPGSYNFRLFENDGHNLLGTSNIVVVSGPQGQTPQPPKPPPVTPPSPPVPPPAVSSARRLTGSWVYSADPRLRAVDNQVIVLHEGEQVTLLGSYRTSASTNLWQTYRCTGPLRGQNLQMACNWIEGGNPNGYAGNWTLVLQVSPDSNRMDGQLIGVNSRQEAHFSREP